MISVKKAFTLPITDLSHKFRVENNNLDIADLLENSGFTAKKIKEFADSHRNERNKKLTANDVFRYVQISDIDVALGRIKSYRSFRGDQAPNNARRIMKTGDILISTRRPTRGAIVSVPEEFNEQICTVFFTTLRIRDWNEVDPGYLALFLRTSLARFQFQSSITETAYPVISDADVLDMTVLLPHIDRQRQIAQEYGAAVTQFFASLNQAYVQITSAKQAIESLVLAEEAEVLEAPTFGLTAAIEEVEDEESSEEQ
jgi:restriction endonuclease S subunit